MVMLMANVYVKSCPQSFRIRPIYKRKYFFQVGRLVIFLLCAGGMADFFSLDAITHNLNLLNIYNYRISIMSILP